tara:strand:+ start:198 stop:692 length:495 start_codon:yes stop_codon:yes gene_type:complete
MKERFLYLDRDGIVNKHIPYVGTLDRFYWHDEIFEIVDFFYKKGFKIIIVTNQSGIQRNYYSFLDFTNICLYIIQEFEKIGIAIEIRACPHLPENKCLCRKPNTGMFLDKRNYDDIMIGDQDSDMQAAKNSGIKNRWLISKEIKSKFATKVFLSHRDLIKYLIT